jgi:hypothetical protein
MLCFLMPFTAQASCGSMADLDSKEFHIYIGDCVENRISFAIADKNGKFGKKKSFLFEKECSMTKDGFKCRADGHTPLAGATYKLIHFGRSRNSCSPESELGAKYICIKGCGKDSVPEYLNADDGSC